MLAKKIQHIVCHATTTICNLPISPYDKNLFTADKAILVVCPVVSSERIASRKGARKTSGDINFRSSIWSTDSFKSLKDFDKLSELSYWNKKSLRYHILIELQ